MATAPFNCFAIAAPGLEAIVARELTSLGERPRLEDGGVGWDGDARSLMRANLWLRTASRVLVRVARFKATAFYDLERIARQIPWDRFVSNGQPVEFRVTSRKSKLYHSDAIEERLVGSVEHVLGGVRSGVGGTSRDLQPPTDANAHVARQLFVVRVLRDEFLISADSSGNHLHMRGYREAVGKAPLRETLAAALLLASDWDGQTPLLDPFCGSGTIAIEGALLARRIAPGLKRQFAFTRWPGMNLGLWRKLTSAAIAEQLPRATAPIVGSDRDAGAIAAARANAERAGVQADVQLEVKPVSAIEPPESPGLVATNPPYGVRVGDRTSVRDLYARLGQVLRRRCADWTVALYSASPRLSNEVRLPFDEMFRTTNGGILIAALKARVPRLA
ncbi:MAG TPA: THUMP domain-containing protein [Gemmatimonadaceae bacterium]|nr:THUMP domain-containing protein [Gemmatimonadaceae bacterium]